jgi:hypothetical protein
MSEQACWRCGRLGHYSRECPGAAPVASVRVEDPPATYRRQVDVECPTCHRDWVAVLTGSWDTPADHRCPWCRKFEVRDGEVYHRA